MTLALALSLALSAAPQPSRAFQQQVDAHLKAAFAQLAPVKSAAKPPQREGRTPARPVAR